MPAIVLAALLYLGFVAALFAGAQRLPGRRVEGRIEPDGTRWTYTLNGLSLFIATHIAVAAGTLIFDISLSFLPFQFWTFFIVINLFTLAVARWLYRRAAAHLPPEQQSGLWRGMLSGIELNPRWRGVDLKMFAYQPSLLSFGLLNVGFAYEQFEYHALITPQMGLYQMGWWLYLATHYYDEEVMLSTWDIIAEKLALPLLWGDLVLVPFFYTIAGWSLVHQTEDMPLAGILAIGALFLAGLWMFRSANAQKHRFKQDPGVIIWGKPAEALDGTLLISGWWGRGRHLNYTGEILVYLAMALTTGFQSFVPYLLPLWMCVLLAHRARRDDRRCREKYGALWERYCSVARYRMVPFVY